MNELLVKILDNDPVMLQLAGPAETVEIHLIAGTEYDQIRLVSGAVQQADPTFTVNSVYPTDLDQFIWLLFPPGFILVVRQVDLQRSTRPYLSSTSTKIEME